VVLLGMDGWLLFICGNFRFAVNDPTLDADRAGRSMLTKGGTAAIPPTPRCISIVMHVFAKLSVCPGLAVSAPSPAATRRATSGPPSLAATKGAAASLLVTLVEDFFVARKPPEGLVPHRGRLPG
jgi:hypothetical protein